VAEYKAKRVSVSISSLANAPSMVESRSEYPMIMGSSLVCR
jgi:hypothetical protein